MPGDRATMVTSHDHVLSSGSRLHAPRPEPVRAGHALPHLAVHPRLRASLPTAEVKQDTHEH